MGSKHDMQAISLTKWCFSRFFQ